MTMMSITKKLLLIPSNAIRKPAVACPHIEAISHVAELMDAAVGNISLGTICEIMAEKVGPENALMNPVIPITEQMSTAIVQ